MATEQFLIDELKRRYLTADRREVVTAVHLFGIVYAAELVGHSINDISEAATGRRSYGTEIRKGMRLARYVVLKG